MDSVDELDLSDDSETVEEVAEVPVQSATEERKPQPSYSVAELDELVTVLKRMVFLSGIKEDDWTEQCNDIIRKWFLDINHIMLIVYYSPKNHLTASLTYPSEPVLEIVYFLREPNHIFSIDTFHDAVTFGQINDDVDGTLLLLMEHLYAPIFFEKTDWTDTNRDEFLAALHSFLSQWTATHYKLLGLTVLYIPNEGLVGDIDKIVENTKLIKRLEAIADHWIDQLRMCLADSEQIVPYDLLCPVDEYDFWTYRCKSLLAVQYQLNHKDFVRIFNILRSSESMFVRPIEVLFARLLVEIDRAQDNVRYLKLLIEPCNELWQAETPTEIPAKLPQIINTIRYIWLNSTCFNQAPSVTKLFRYVGNQIIQFCCRKIDVSAIFNGAAQDQIKMANMSIDCCIYYKLIYRKIAELPDNEDWLRSIDNGLVFNHVDSFIQRAYDLIEVCHGITIFSGKSSPAQLEFGGDRGREFESVCGRIEARFDKAIAKIKRNSASILNINDKTWFKSKKEFREVTASLEEICDNLIINVFTRVDNMEDGIYALACLHRFSTRDKLYKTFKRKVADVWQMFGEEMSKTNDELGDESDENLSVLPEQAGRTACLNVNRYRLNRLKSLFKENVWLPPDSIDTEPISSNYKILIDVIQTTAQEQFTEWIQSLGVDIVSKLNRLLLRRSLTHSGLFECNIDDSIFTIFRESRFFRWLGFKFPVYLTQFFNRERSIRLIYDAIIEMITSYNRILMGLSEPERLLLKPMTQLCDKCIAPGSLRLTWATDGLDTYISDCNKAIRELSDFIRIYQQTNAKIVRSCERVCEICAVKIPNDKPRQLPEIEHLIGVTMNKQIACLSMEFGNVCKLILSIHDEIEEIETIQELWIDYVLKFDRLIEEALTISARESFLSIFGTLNGNGVLGPEALLCVTLDIQEAEIVQTPNSDNLRAMLQTVYQKLSQSYRNIPRLLQTLKLPPPEPLRQFVEVISSDTECKQLQSKIEAEIECNDIKMKHYEARWMHFADIWESDKATVIRELESDETAVAQKYDKKLQDLLSLSNQVSLREVSTKVNFSMVDATKLRRAIIIEIDDWKRRYLISLKIKTESKTRDFFRYIKENGQNVSIVPKSVDELKKCCAIYEQLRNEVDDSKYNLYCIRDQFVVLERYGVAIDGEFNEMKQNITMQWENYLKQLDEANEVLNNAKDSFKLTLESTRKTPDFF